LRAGSSFGLGNLFLGFALVSTFERRRDLFCSECWYSETAVIANSSADSGAVPKHDILEVNNYFMSGLVVSSIDKWFMGPVPSFAPRDLGLPGDSYSNIASVLEKARLVLNTPGQIAWQAVRIA
jgi:hypothetical protein